METENKVETAMKEPNVLYIFSRRVFLELMDKYTLARYLLRIEQNKKVPTKRVWVFERNGETVSALNEILAEIAKGNEVSTLHD